MPATWKPCQGKTCYSTARCLQDPSNFGAKTRGYRQWGYWGLVISAQLLSHFSRVRLCATPSLGYSRLEHWSGLPFPSPMHKSEKWKWSRSVISDSSQPHGLQPTRLLCPWDFPGKSTGVGCHCLLRFCPKPFSCNKQWASFSLEFPMGWTGTVSGLQWVWRLSLFNLAFCPFICHKLSPPLLLCTPCTSNSAATPLNWCK